MPFLSRYFSVKSMNHVLMSVWLVSFIVSVSFQKKVDNERNQGVLSIELEYKKAGVNIQV